MNYSTGLEAKVAARNAVNAEIRAEAPKFLEAMKPFVGKKILKADGNFTKAFLDAMPKSGWAWVNSRYSVARYFRASKNAGSTFYQESSVYFGDTTGDTLTKLTDFSESSYRVDYDVATIREHREAVKTARAAMQAAESKLHYFGEHDNN